MGFRRASAHIKCRYRLEEDGRMEKLPKGIILAAHKPIASAMLKAATQIMGPIDHCAAADIDSDAKESDQFEHLKKVWDSVQT